MSDSNILVIDMDDKRYLSTVNNAAYECEKKYGRSESGPELVELFEKEYNCKITKMDPITIVFKSPGHLSLFLLKYCA